MTKFTFTMQRAATGRIVTTVLAASAMLSADTHTAYSCPPDLNFDGVVDVIDYLLLQGDYGPCPGCPSDFNGDGVVDLVDHNYLLENWGPCPSTHPGTVELFDEIIVIDATDPGAAAAGLVVTHVYATGASVTLDDALLLARDAQINPINTVFFHEPNVGSHLPPDSSWIPTFPDIVYDTFFTMHELIDYTPLVEPGFVMSDTDIQGNWTTTQGLPAPQRNAEDISALTGTPDQYGVRIAQITLVAGSNPSNIGYSGTVRLFTSTHQGGSLQGIDTPVQYTHQVPPACPADLNHDSVVDTNDLLILLNSFGPCSDPNNCPADLNGDGAVGMVDLAYLVDSWGQCPHELFGATELFDDLVSVKVSDQQAKANGLIVTHLYATGDNVALGDRLMLVEHAGIAADANTQFFLSGVGAFCDHGTPPASVCLALNPLAAYNTFATMRELVDYTPLAQSMSVSSLGLQGNWIGFDTDDTRPGTEREAVDISHLTGSPGQHGVLIAQITMHSEQLLGYDATARLYTSPENDGSIAGVDVSLQYVTKPADLNGDCDVNVSDLLILLGAWGQCADPDACPADLNGDGTVDVSDLLMLLGNWGPC